jgi:hypothetical protein
MFIARRSVVFPFCFSAARRQMSSSISGAFLRRAAEKQRAAWGADYYKHGTPPGFGTLGSV